MSVLAYFTLHFEMLCKISKGITVLTPVLIIYYTRDPCSSHHCQSPNKCYANNGFSFECVDFCVKNDCSGSGSCYNSTCHCDTGSQGLFCEFSTCYEDKSKCLNGGTCIDLPKSDWREGVDPFFCRCKSDFYYGDRCEHEVCSPELCFNGGTCKDEHQAGCNCIDGYAGEQCENYMKDDL